MTINGVLETYNNAICIETHNQLHLHTIVYSKWSIMVNHGQSWRGGSGHFNPSLIFLPKKATFKPRPHESKQCILRCESTSRSFTSRVMASSHRAPKQWCLSKVETITSFENWKQTCCTHYHWTATSPLSLSMAFNS